MADTDEATAGDGQLSEPGPAIPRPAGVTTARLNLRAGPGMEHAVLETLPAQTLVELLDEEDVWLHVAALGRQGYVHRNFVTFPDGSGAAGFLHTRPELDQVPLAPPEAEAITLAPATADGTTSVLASAWNSYGGLLAVLADELKIDPGVALSVFVVEAPGGRGFADDGRMIIRFENHIFFDHWGRQHPDRFDRHFRFNPEKRWQGHQWRPAPDQPWRDCHTSQQAEWEVLEFARTLDDTAARLSISMGAPQIMGFNHDRIGYGSVQEMFEAFSAGERSQILGFFDFVRGSSADSPALLALQGQDFKTFAALYNGAGQATLYGDLIASRFAAFQQLKPAAPPAEAPQPGDISFLPVPEPGAAGRALSEMDPRLYDYWREHIRAGFERNNEMFTRILNGFMEPYYTTIWMYRILFAVGIAAFLTAAGLSIWTQNASFSLVFGGLSVAAFLTYFLSRPLRSLEENLEFITWLGLVYNTYWTRLAYMMDQETVQQDLAQASKDATDEIQRIIKKHAEMSKQRPGLG